MPQNLITSILLLSFGGFMAWQAGKLSLGTVHMPGPGFFPFYLGIILVLLNIPILFTAGKKNTTTEEELKPQRVFLTLLTLLLYAFIVENLGYVPATFLFVLVLLQLATVKNVLFILVLSFGISLLSYGLFKELLGVPLPRGVWFF